MRLFKRRYTNEERRVHRRRNIYSLIKYRPAGGGEPYLETVASLRDISAGGIFFKTKKRFAVNTVLNIRINLAPLEREICAAAQVVRVEKVKGKDTYAVGAKFVQIEKEDRRAIEIFIQTLA